MGLISIRLYML